MTYSVYEQGEREFLVRLARDAFRLPAWEGDFNAPELDVSTLDSLWLESTAEQIRCYGAALVPDLLRTPDYAEAVVRREYGPQVSESELACVPVFTAVVSGRCLSIGRRWMCGRWSPRRC